MDNQKKYFIGLMSGTSMDAVDAALVSFENNRPQLINTASITLSEKIKSALAILLKGSNIDLTRLGETDVVLGHLFADAALKVLQNTRLSTDNISAIGSHGQTIYHAPNGVHPFTLQIADPNIIVARTQITTVADFRRRDIALGGQGAPLTPAFHAYLFGRDQTSWVLNLGGIANITFLSKNNPIIGFDTGPANTLLDQWCEKHTGKSYDKNGDWARTGKIIPELLLTLLDDAYFKKPFPKSTGREYFNMDWLQYKLGNAINHLPAENIQTTLTELTAKTIADDIQKTSRNSGNLWLCGGGANNVFLIERLKNYLPHHQILSTETAGIHPQWIEAAAFAWLAKETMERKMGNLPSVTGASQESILGGVYYA
ncbi:MAG: anhydro-N-acetylmuramic acid kinase [Coxiellaceae bacterium]|nr:anhydro-N-acetylmuramic acid kinase [Coxiellaceae bacterium]